MGPYEPGSDGIYRPPWGVEHRDEEYDPRGFRLLLEMQTTHFWYRGRHAKVLSTLDRALEPGPEGLSAIDLGGGCGGWVMHLARARSALLSELALGDSSVQALGLARDAFAEAELPLTPDLYQLDLERLGWEGRWDVAFLLDVIEHLDDDVAALAEVRKALRPGGVCLVTVPALPSFWSYADDLAHHRRRYTAKGLTSSARRAGLEVRSCRYFMFLLAPLLYLQRLGGLDVSEADEETKAEALRRLVAVPARPVNELLSGILHLENAMGRAVPFPWGTSLIAALCAPRA
ncbi:MAG: methyltransferase [Armatimonadia bacterium]|nr:methyltransferase [Armatimonadia bacterium]